MTISEETQLRVRLAGARAARDEAVRERNRLRVVVDAAIEAVDAHRAWIAKAQTGDVISVVGEETHRSAAAMATLCLRVDQLREPNND